MNETIPTFNNLIRQSEYTNTGVLWASIYSLGMVIYIISEFLKVNYEFFSIFFIIVLPLHDLFTNQFLSFQTMKKGRSLLSYYRETRSITKIISNELSLLGVFSLLNYFSFFISFVNVMNKNFLYALIFLALSDVFLITNLVIITKRVYTAAPNYYKTKYHYVKYSLIIFSFLILLEIMIFSAIFNGFLHESNIVLVFLLHLIGLIVILTIGKIENQSVEIDQFVQYARDFVQMESDSNISNYFSNLPKMLIESKYNLDFAFAISLALIFLAYIVGTVLLNILEWTSMHWISIAFWIITGLIVAFLLVILISKISTTRSYLNRQMSGFQQVVSRFEESNQKYINILGE